MVRCEWSGLSRVDILATCTHEGCPRSKREPSEDFNCTACAEGQCTWAWRRRPCQALPDGWADLDERLMDMKRLLLSAGLGIEGVGV